jgi:hypothetical protein
MLRSGESHGVDEPVPALGRGIHQCAFAGIEFRLEAVDVVVGLGSLSATNGQRRGKKTVLNCSGQRGDQKFANRERLGLMN